jgi:capsular polysaccharide biosynthesis protein
MGGPPAGMFTEEADLLAAKVRGQVIPKPEFPEIPEDSEVSKAGLGQNKHSNWVCLWTCRDNAFLAAPSLAHVDCTGRVCLEAVYGPHAWSDPVWQRKRKLPIRELAGDFTSIISRWNLGGNYYHWFLDGLTRLIHLQDFPMDCRILIPRRPPAFVRRSIELLGLANRVVETGDEDLRIERYWFAGPTMLSGCPDPLGVRWLRRKFLREPQPARRRLLYLERNATTRIVINAAEVRRFFACRGWEILDPGELSLDEQIRLFREAKAVVGPHGAALTNLLWAAPGTRVLEFMPARRRNGCYAGISLLTGLAHRTLVCPSDRDANIHAPMERLAEWENRMRSGLDAG